MTPSTLTNHAARIQSQLLCFAALFVFLYATALCLSPAARVRSWQVEYRWEVWWGFAAWALAFGLLHRVSIRQLRNHDPYLLPVASLLCGWGLMSIWRLYPTFGLRQSAWLLIGAGLITILLRIPRLFSHLRRFRYLWLSAGLLLTALTFFIGTNPSGNDAWNYWLGCCGIYLQPSEPLKLFLVIYLAAYLADLWLAQPDDLQPITAQGNYGNLNPYKQGRPWKKISLRVWRLLVLFAPTLVMFGLALVLLVAQQDLGTASIFMVIYAVMAFLATGQLAILMGGGFALLGAGLAGYLLFAVVRLRVDAWLNPWLEPSGRSYQIVQSLISIANGGLIGRGPGLGNPGLVPLAHSDFILTAIIEENGLLGAVGIVLLLAIIAFRGLRVAALAPNSFQRYLAAGLTTQLVGQAILIIGGNQRLLPLTGVTLPFVSYGGSSLVISFIALGLLLKISQLPQTENTRSEQPALRLLASFFALALFISAISSGWWTIIRAANLVDRTDNPRKYLVDDYVVRGSLLDRQNTPLVQTTGEIGEYQRQVNYPQLSSILGYSDPIYGQSGLEGALDLILSGRQGTPTLNIWLDHLLYGQPPPGLNIRLSLDLSLQKKLDELLGFHTGAAVVLNSTTGEILALASHPTYNSNSLAADWENLISDPGKPLLNRATQGLYPPGASLGPLLLAALNDSGITLPAKVIEQVSVTEQTCALPVVQKSLDSFLRNGCPQTTLALAEALGPVELYAYLKKLGLFTPPNIGLPMAVQTDPGLTENLDPRTALETLHVSPLQMALAAAVINNQGTSPAPHLVISVELPKQGWTPRPPAGNSTHVFTASVVDKFSKLLQEDMMTWSVVAQNPMTSGGQVSWYIGGNLPGSNQLPVIIVVLLEEDNPRLVEQIGQALQNQYR